MLGRFDRLTLSGWFGGIALIAVACGSGPLGGVQVGFNVSGQTVDFGRALEGTQVSRTVTLQSAGRADLTVTIATTDPFSAPPSVVVPGGGSVDIGVVFTAGDGIADAQLQLSARGHTVSVPLHGEGVKPLACTPSAPCQISKFDLAQNACVESVAPDGTSCLPTSRCLDNGVCHSGNCVGTPRNCDDSNACTEDACSEGIGCVHTPVSCPPPSQPCQETTCDPTLGCGFGAVGDGQPCGAVDCVTANLCIGGKCQSLPTPDNFVCAPATPCRGQGTCQSHQCVLPDAGDLAPSFSVGLDTPPAVAPSEAPTLLSFDGNLFWEACDLDAGCSLISFTGNGFERFASPAADPGPRMLVAVSDGGAIVETADGLEAYAQTDGTLLWTLPNASLVPPAELPGFVAQTGPARLAEEAGGALEVSYGWLPPTPDPDAGDGGADAGTFDGGLAPDVQTLVRVDLDGGLLSTQVIRGAGAQARLGLDEGGGTLLYDPSGPYAFGAWTDAGFTLQSLANEPGEASLATATGSVLAGAEWLLAESGGLIAPLLPQDAGVPKYPDGRFALAAEGFGYVFYQSCLPPLVDPCGEDEKTTILRAVDLSTGALAWENIVAPGGPPVFFEEAALVQGGGVATLSQTSLDGGWEAYAQLFIQGQRIFVCRLPPPTVLGGAVFDRGFLYSVVQRDAGWSLEAYDLQGLPLETSGWPQRNGLSGGRRAVP